MKEIESLNAPESEEYVYVREPAAMESLIRNIVISERVAVDTEADSLHNYFEKVCLIQLSLEGEHYLVDPLTDVNLSVFLDALADKPLVLHGGDYDLRMLRASTGFRPRGEVFDTMIAAQLLGIEQIGLAALIERSFDIIIPKDGQKSDWSRRPLSEMQLRYAINDTRFLEPLAGHLGRELRQRGRIDWHKESCRAMVESTGRDRLRAPELAWRIKGSGRLTRRQLAYLRELWHWRDQRARRANTPSFKIFGNQQILDLVQWLDSHPAMPLQQGPKLPRNIRGTLQRTLEEAIARVAGLDPAQWPERIKLERPDAAPADVIQRLNALRGECARIAKELEIAAGTLAPKAALEAIAWSRPQTVDEIMKSGGLLRWQAGLIEGAVDKCLHSTRC
ncbi:MAG: HRDC domain-containing protein [Deltaproteobacteria bacterium]|nr:HRDC domain-containing protein [Deltaproteobacteria bacterium]